MTDFKLGRLIVEDSRDANFPMKADGNSIIEDVYEDKLLKQNI